MLFWLASLALAAESCPEAAAIVATSAAARVELAFMDVDPEAFEKARLDLETAIPCIDSEVPVPDAMAMHRARAVTAMYDGDMEVARRALIAIRTVQPDWKPSAQLIPPEHVLYKAFADAVPSDAWIALPQNAGGWNVDGLRSTQAPSERAFVLQAFSISGAVVLTRYCESLACLADAESVALHASASRRESSQRRLRVVGFTVGGALLGASAAGFAEQAAAVRRYADITDDTAAARLRDTSRVAGAAGYSALGLGLGAVATTFIVAF